MRNIVSSVVVAAAPVAAVLTKVAEEEPPAAGNDICLPAQSVVQDVDPRDWELCLAMMQKFNAFDGLTDDAKNGFAWFAPQTTTHQDLLGLPGHLCMDSFNCAFENCALTPILGPEVGKKLELLKNYRPAENQTIVEFTQQNGMNLNIPEQIAFPKSVKDVVDAVNYAQNNCMPISVKSTGHSWTGASTLKESVQINMYEFPKESDWSFSQSIAQDRLPQVVPCNETILASVGLEVPSACKAALARGSPGIVRAGGGETWGEVSSAVFDSNILLETPQFGGQPFEVTTGGAGTVGASGGWLQGGGLLLGQEKLFGYGIDNLLEIEMVLPDGQHVKFGPCDWKDEEGFLYPQTTEVCGFCNKNVVEDESQWDWQECQIEYLPNSFKDLWYALRGGGGGTWGVVTGTTYQAHDRRTLYEIHLNTTAYTSVCPMYLNTSISNDNVAFTGFMSMYTDIEDAPKECVAVQNALMDFWIDFLYDPAALDMGFTESPQCGSPMFAYNVYNFLGIWCFDDARNDFYSAWNKYWADYKTNNPDLIPQGMESNWDTWATVDQSLTKENVDHYQQLEKFYIVDQARTYNNAAMGSMDRHNPSIYVPVEFLLRKDDLVHDFLTGTNGWHTAGGNVNISSDGMDSFSKTARMAAGQANSMNLFGSVLPALNEIFNNTDGDIFGMLELNHMGAQTYGPLKSDINTPCPWNFTVEEANDQCYSSQEYIWGTDTLTRLEGIQSALDPNGLWQAAKGVNWRGGKPINCSADDASSSEDHKTKKSNTKGNKQGNKKGNKKK